MLTVLLTSSIFASPQIELTSNIDRNKILLVDKKDSSKIINIHTKISEKLKIDDVLLTLVIHTKGKKLSTVLEKNSKISKQIKDDLLKYKFDIQNIVKSKYSELANTRMSKIVKEKDYQIINTLEISVKSENEIRDISKIIDENENVFLYSIKKIVMNEKIASHSLLKKALIEINKKVELYKKSLGIKLTVVDFDEQYTLINNKIILVNKNKDSFKYKTINNVINRSFNLTLDLNVNYILSD
jgi:hypothetical protein